MGNFATSKLLAGIGSLLLCLSFLLCSVFTVGHLLPFLFISCIIGICGMASILIGMKGLAEHYKEYKIYKKICAGAIFGIICYVVLPLMLMTALSHYFSPTQRYPIRACYAVVWSCTTCPIDECGIICVYTDDGNMF
ncbi:MAG: hypothetical protein LBE70_02650 [Nitrososphaerota archaeon]|nr:hypothetical protein [Nitrososphaerota archaeon]